MEIFFSADPAFQTSSGPVVGEDRIPASFGTRLDGTFGDTVVSVFECTPRRTRASELPALLRRMVGLQHEHVV